MLWFYAIFFAVGGLVLVFLATTMLLNINNTWDVFLVLPLLILGIIGLINSAAEFYDLGKSAANGKPASQTELQSGVIYEVIWYGKIGDKNFVLATTYSENPPKLYELDEELPEDTTHFVYDDKDGEKKVFPYRVLKSEN